MVELNLSVDQQAAIGAIDADVMHRLVGQCLDDRSIASLRSLPLERCGPYVWAKLRAFEQALADDRAAKAPNKQAEAAAHARRAGGALSDALGQMRHRLEVEQREAQRFHVEDQILPPSQFDEDLSVRISYRWRPAIDAEWVYGGITFVHQVDTRPDYAQPLPKRKPSARQQERDRQDRLYREWEHLMRLGLQSMREFFRSGGDAAAIPATFRAQPDARSRGLNNFSANFWLARPPA